MENNMIKELRASLVPKGTLPVVRIFLKDNTYYKQEFVESCINELERKLLLVRAEMEELTPLEKLAIAVLVDSSYIELGEPK
jgi:hypothetical protein